VIKPQKKNKQVIATKAKVCVSCGWPPVANPAELSVFELDIITPSSTRSIKNTMVDRGYADAILCATNILKLKSI
jgi:hypothetical protein